MVLHQAITLDMVKNNNDKYRICGRWKLPSGTNVIAILISSPFVP
jgi:hypothetical protein